MEGKHEKDKSHFCIAPGGGAAAHVLRVRESSVNRCIETSSGNERG